MTGMIDMRHFIAASCLALALCGCNAEGPGPSAPAVAVPVATARKLPPGAGCGSAISSYQTIVKSDLDTGNVDQKVYDEISRELDRASAACESGRDGEARSLVAASKERHGYHN